MRRGIRRTLPAVALAGALIPGLMLISTTETPRTAARTAVAADGPCVSTTDPATARRVGNGIKTALRGRKGTISVAVYDRRRRVGCYVSSSRRFDSASVIKVTILGATLRRAIEQGRLLNAREKSLAGKMITRSDNDAASALWKSVGRARMQRFVAMAGMARTTLGPGGYWGLSQITALDQLRLLGKLTSPNKVLTDRARAYALSLMNKVVKSQRWGTPAGAPAGARVHVKNGWLPRSTHGWRVHSIGSFDGGDRDYMIVVLSHGNSSMTYGVRTIEGVARAVHRDLNPGQRSMMSQSPQDPTWEIPDGSAPRHAPTDLGS